ncbi:MAG TPA: metallophosphoesterase family protein [Anaerolineae bacterium]|nr:metallophosphoesterase family protein [Anaerolineae bacterium]
MRCLVLSDIHANLAALEAVLADAGRFDFIWCLGDVIGYGPDPNESVACLREFPHLCLAGNHDWAALGKLDLRGFNTDARLSAEWTQKHLDPAARAYLQALPPSCVESGYTLAHGSPRQPIWEYILDPLTAEHNFNAFATTVCLVGHTHIPALFVLPDPDDAQGVEPHQPEWNCPIHLNSGRWIVNPGSVGQPRDGNPDASYALLDLEHNTWEYRRIRYPVHETQRRMREQGFPARLIDRLAQGH